MKRRSPLIAQALAETKMTLRRGESVLLAVVIPLAALIGFSKTSIINFGTAKPINFLVPGILTLTIMSTSMVGLSISTGFERYYGVLKRLGTTPLGRGRLLAAKALSVTAIEILQATVVVVAGLMLSWRVPSSGPLVIAQAVAVSLLAGIAFSAIGLLIAGTISAFAVLGLSNTLWFVMLLVSGIVAPISKLPQALQVFSKLLPSTALSQALHGLFGGLVTSHGSVVPAAQSVPVSSWLVLAVWAAVAGALAAWKFKWE